VFRLIVRLVSDATEVVRLRSIGRKRLASKAALTESNGVFVSCVGQVARRPEDHVLTDLDHNRIIRIRFSLPRFEETTGWSSVGLTAIQPKHSCGTWNDGLRLFPDDSQSQTLRCWR
jgi:hypothetical protein